MGFFFPHLLEAVEQPCYNLTYSPHKVKQYKRTAAPSPNFLKFIVFSDYLTIQDSAKYHQLTYTETF